MSAAYRIAAQTADHLSIVVPGSSLLNGWTLAVIAVPVLLIFYLTSRTVARVYSQDRSPGEVRAAVWRYRLFGLGILLAGLGLFWALSYSSGSIDLDRARNVATMRSKMTIFLPVSEASLPLSSVSEAVLDKAPNARRIRLVGDGAVDLGYPIWSDRKGQDEILNAINAFLGHRKRDG